MINVRCPICGKVYSNPKRRVIWLFKASNARDAKEKFAKFKAYLTLREKKALVEEIERMGARW
jgi:sarcosine oxidase delta subunit